MLRHSLATLEGVFVFYRALLPLYCSPLSLFVTLFSIFSLQTCACMLEVPRACPRAFNKCMALGEVKKEKMCALFFDQLKGGCGSVMPGQSVKFF